MEVSKENPIIVAGAGPVGCTFALYLALRGIPVVVLESEPQMPVNLRASTWHPPTLDMLDELGISQPLVKVGLKVPRYQYRDRRSDLHAEFDLGVLEGETNHPYRIQVEQYRMTRIAQVMLETLPCAEIRLGHVVETVWQDSDFVMVKIRTPEGTQEFRAPFVLGADGASSNVRVSAGIAYEGFTFPEKFLIASTPYPFDEHFPNLAPVSYFADSEEWFLTLKCGELWRVLVPTDPEADPDYLLSDDYIEKTLQGLVPKSGNYEIGHRTLYPVHQRVAQTYHKGRIFLAGDAAHINNPLGGMGMNGGIHDAYNLAQKMYAYLQGDVGEDVFELYDRQRRTMATKFVQKHTIRNKEQLENKDPAKIRQQIEDMIKTAADPEAAKEFLRETSMLNCLREADAIT